MQSNRINVLMVSYGRGALYENKAGVLDRHLEYASHFNSLKIIYLTKKRLKKKVLANLTIVPVYSKSYLICFLKALFINVRNYNIVTTQDPFLTGLLGLYHKKIFKIKLHIQNHSNFIDNKYWIKENKFNLLLNYIAKKIILPQANRLRVVNTFEKQIYIDKLNIPENIIDIAPIAINQIFTNKISETEISVFKKKHQINSNRVKIGWAGRFVRLKRLDYLFELVSSIEQELDIQLILAGDFKSSEIDLKYLENKYLIKPIFTGQLAANELVKFYQTLDVFVLTSEYEGYGVVLKEALATGCPVLVWNKSKGTNDIISKTKNGYYFNTKSDFHNKLIQIIKNGFKKEEIKRDNKSDVIYSIKRT
jgi:glycosyltransferase involved in cell wall biosynthesis